MPDLRFSLPCYAQTWESIHGHLAARTLETGRPSVELPTVFVLGEKSPIPPRHGEASAALIPGALVQIHAGCGHMLWIDKPGVVRAAVDTLAASW
jgi:pimeloyl-ACP methyl ester carboxylesterase